MKGCSRAFPRGSYFLLVDSTGRLFRDGEGAISSELAGVLDRPGFSAEKLTTRLEALRNGRLLGRFFSGSRARLQGDFSSKSKRLARDSTEHLTGLRLWLATIIGD